MDTATSPTSLSSPFFTLDSASGPNSFVENRQPASGQPGSNNFQRPRSQTFPMLVGVEQYMSLPGSSDALTPKYVSSSALDSSMTEIPGAPPAINEGPSPSPTQVPNFMQPSPLLGASQVDDKGSSADSSPITPSHEEAAQALELVINFFQSQNAGFAVEPQDYVTIGKLMERLRIKHSYERRPSKT